MRWFYIPGLPDLSNRLMHLFGPCNRCGNTFGFTAPLVVYALVLHTRSTRPLRVFGNAPTLYDFVSYILGDFICHFP